MRLFTVGYERRTQVELIELLRGAGVTTLLDVREDPISRVPGFSKNRLRAALEDAGMAYRHDRAWGNPTHLRKAPGPVRKILEGYRSHVRSCPRALESFGSAAMAPGERVCALCYERDPSICHRTVLAEEWARFAGIDLELVHLGC